ncbi:hypothetical protein J2847_006743 [Azospirillum agricola]|uniref:hypothetical protein n=1 Tax=Azospirillum agricola TaxID=1720247 RepID=UPI001AEB2815|nr:hypothetical protein [Azospirillum agricola]MBP2233405.1 hypothetical protein [Azospirillum agricola]
MDEWLAAWGLWLSGTKLPDTHPLWGHTIVWWNRIGQIFQFLAALIVIIEIIGKENINNFVESLNKFTPKFHYKNPNPYTYEDRKKDREIIKGFALAPIVGAALLLVNNIISSLIKTDWLSDFVYSVSLLLIFPSIAALLYFTSIIILFFILYGPTFLLRALLSNKKSDRIFKAFGLFLAISGFHFTLLAS